jgi:hypothetical protein
MSGPNSAPELGQQNYRTPKAFLEACARRGHWSRYGWDLACTPEDCVAVKGGYFYPDFDALERDWRELGNLLCWCNPPFAQAGAFARKAAESGIRAHLLVPVALGTVWWRKYVHQRALVAGVGRVRFLKPDGTPMPAAINRDCAVLHYGPGVVPGYACEAFSEW